MTLRDSEYRSQPPLFSRPGSRRRKAPVGLKREAGAKPFSATPLAAWVLERTCRHGGLLPQAGSTGPWAPAVQRDTAPAAATGSGTRGALGLGPPLPLNHLRLSSSSLTLASASTTLNHISTSTLSPSLPHLQPLFSARPNLTQLILSLSALTSPLPTPFSPAYSPNGPQPCSAAPQPLARDTLVCWLRNPAIES